MKPVIINNEYIEIKYMKLILVYRNHSVSSLQNC